MPTAPKYHLLTPKVAIDCEMTMSNIGPILGRVSLVNYNNRVIFDTFVCHPRPIIITDTRYAHSGIDWNNIDPDNGAMYFDEVQEELQELLADRIVIGHAVSNDARVISMDLSNPNVWLRRPTGRAAARNMPTLEYMVAGVRDTQKFSGCAGLDGRPAGPGPSLKVLASEVLGREIKKGRVSSVEDARATMEVYREAERDIDREQRGRWFGF
jgi:RNA exonuclease 4